MGFTQYPWIAPPEVVISSLRRVKQVDGYTQSSMDGISSQGTWMIHVKLDSVHKGRVIIWLRGYDSMQISPVGVGE